MVACVIRMVSYVMIMRDMKTEYQFQLLYDTKVVCDIMIMVCSTNMIPDTV